MPKVDVPEIKTPASEGRYVEIPEQDIFEQPHPAIRINGMTFGPGKHFIANDLADTVEERLKTYQRASIRILQPKKDSDAESVVSKGQGVATTGF